MNNRDLTKVGLFTALTIIASLISINIGEIPITLQTAFVLLSGLVLGPKLGAMVQIVYLLLGLVGLPVFAGGVGGLSRIFSPSFGFILGFIPAAYIVGMAQEDFSRSRVVLGLIGGEIVNFTLGLSYMYFILNYYVGKSVDLTYVLKYGLIPFIPGEIIKMLLVYLLAFKIHHIKQKRQA